jgi:hypothetical protein
MKRFIYKTKFSDCGGIKLATVPRENCLKGKRLKVGCSNGLGINPNLTLRIKYLKLEESKFAKHKLILLSVSFTKSNFLIAEASNLPQCQEKTVSNKKDSMLDVVMV